jgi:uridine kinase
MPVTDSTRPSRPVKAPHIVGVAGGSGSGKTYFAEAVVNKLGPAMCTIVFQDNFYIDQSNRFDHDGGAVNFDHPNSIDFDLLADCLAELKQGRTTQIPVYDFVTHKRLPGRLALEPTPVVLVDGILIFHSLRVRELLDERIFFDTSEELRYHRRRERDVHERGRTPDGVEAQFYKQVKPMHDLFVEPSKVHAGTVIRENSGFDRVLAEYCGKLALHCRS